MISSSCRRVVRALRYERVGRELAHALKYNKGYARVVEKVMAPLMTGMLDGGRFDGVVPVSLHRAPLAKRVSKRN